MLLYLVLVLFVALPVGILLAIRPARKDLKGWTVLITGAGQGLGQELATQFAERGCRLVLWDIKPSVIDVAKSMPGEAHGFVVDVSDEESVRDAAKQTLALTEVDVVINNAGIVAGRSFLQETPEQTAKVMQVNFFGTCAVTRQFLPAMLERNKGHIVTISSIMASAYTCDLGSYCASKAALLAWHNCLRMEINRESNGGVQTTVVCPYAIKTDMFQGCRFSMQWLIPLLTPQLVASSVVEAVEYNHPTVILPSILRLVLVALQLVPTAITDACLVHFGRANSILADFRGGISAAKQAAEEKKGNIH